MLNASAQQQLSDLSRRVAQIETQQALHQLVSESCQGMDRRDIALFRAIWWDDSIWNLGSPFEPFVGIEAISHAVEDVIYAVWSRTHHLTGNIVIATDGSGAASGTCDVTAVVVRSDGLVHTIGATYDDRFACRDGEWRIARRDVITRFITPHPGLEVLSLQALKS